MGINSQTEKQQNNEWVLGDLFWEMEITKNVILLPNKLLANSFWFEWTQTDFHLHCHCNHRIITLSLTISTLVIHMTVSSLLPSSRGYYLAILELNKYLNMLYLWYAVYYLVWRVYVFFLLSGFPSTLDKKTSILPTYRSRTQGRIPTCTHFPVLGTQSVNSLFLEKGKFSLSEWATLS